MKVFYSICLLLLASTYLSLASSCSGISGMGSNVTHQSATDTASEVPDGIQDGSGTEKSPSQFGNNLNPDSSGEIKSGEGQYQIQSRLADNSGVGLSNEGHVNPGKSLMIPTVKWEGVVTDLDKVSDGIHCFKDTSISTPIFQTETKPKFKVETRISEQDPWSITFPEPYNSNAEIGWDNDQGWYPMNACGQSITEFRNPMYVSEINFETMRRESVCSKQMLITATYEKEGTRFTAKRLIDCKEVKAPPAGFPKPIVLELLPPLPSESMLKIVNP